MKLRIYQIDAFSNHVFGGNYAAVVPLPAWLPDSKMQQIASENNLSETAFYVARDPSDLSGAFEIRWFSPITEIDFCGHATLASAFVIFNLEPKRSEIVFETAKVGRLTVKRGKEGLLEMDFPNQAPEPVTEIPADLLEGLSIKPVHVLKNRQAYFAVYDNESDVRTVIPDLERIKKLGPLDVVVTAPGTDVDFVSRYFWPANGGAEDPVTGSIHTGLAPYWAARLGKETLHAFQASHRGGHVFLELRGDRVIVSGHAVKYLEGVIHV
jgi:PhzF family phenazine biosynthesis protein